MIEKFWESWKCGGVFFQLEVAAAEYDLEIIFIKNRVGEGNVEIFGMKIVALKKKKKNLSKMIPKKKKSVNTIISVGAFFGLISEKPRKTV